MKGSPLPFNLKRPSNSIPKKANEHKDGPGQNVNSAGAVFVDAHRLMITAADYGLSVQCAAERRHKNGAGLLGYSAHNPAFGQLWW
ncbi:hypothetical protein D3C76_1765860 [compost metagenome]